MWLVSLILVFYKLAAYSNVKNKVSHTDVVKYKPLHIAICVIWEFYLFHEATGGIMIIHNIGANRP